MATLTVTTRPTPEQLNDPSVIKAKASDDRAEGLSFYQITNISDEPVEIDGAKLMTAIREYEVIKAVEDAAAELGLHTLVIP